MHTTLRKLESILSKHDIRKEVSILLSDQNYLRKSIDLTESDWLTWEVDDYVVITL
jgi:hypothetical protein